MVWAVKIMSIIGSVELDIGVCSSFPLLTLPRPHPLSPSLFHLHSLALSHSLWLSPSLLLSRLTRFAWNTLFFAGIGIACIARSGLPPRTFRPFSRSLSASSRRLSCRLVLGENCLVAFPCQIFGRLPWGSPDSPPLSPASFLLFFFSLFLFFFFFPRTG